MSARAWYQPVRRVTAGGPEIPGNRFKMKRNRKTINRAALLLAAGALSVTSVCAKGGGASGTASTGRELPETANGLIPPSTPLVACDPYFSIWSPGDKLNGVETTHWTGKKNQLTSVIKIDGKAYRVIGARPESAEPLEQKSLTVLPTRTIYTFEGGGVALDLTFTTPALPGDIDLLSRPVTYLTYDFKSTDSKEHEVSVFFGASADVTVNTPDQAVTWKDESAAGLTVVSAGSKDQQVLQKAGDDQRIDWGYFYIAAPDTATTAVSFAKPEALGEAFAAKGLDNAKGATGAAPHAADAGLGIELKAVKVGAAPVSTWLMVAYDDLYSIQYNHKNLRPYWRRTGWEAKDLLGASAKQYAAIKEHCEAFDKELMADLTAAGGEKYAKISALAYRQCFAAGKFVADEKGQPISFCKENHSNGCIATSDVFYPMAPQFLLFGSTVAKSFVTPFMNYAKSDRWKFPFAPHDLGTYPHANGQVYGGGERTEENQMPVEESGNMLIMLAALARVEGNADYSARYWPQITKWAEYLKEKGLDPENQLSTDDFAGHLAHNANLSIKAILALGAYSQLAAMTGHPQDAARYRQTAQEFAKKWVELAIDGDHYKLAFDKPGTWSQKYNLVWDKLLGLNLFPKEIASREIA
ncbi:MAG: glutaminase [Akkermansiaceae bacterium]|nr:glutaminase [Akkermansiaceae bacterium]